MKTKLFIAWLTLFFFQLSVFTPSFSQPTLTWADQLGGTDFDAVNAIALDGSGNSYITGSFSGTADFDPGAAAVNLTSAGLKDIFVCKLDPAGNLLWVRQMGGTNVDAGNGIALDGNGDVYITGYFWGTADFDPGVATYNLTASGMQDAFICKLDPSGNFVWAKQIGGASLAEGVSIKTIGLGSMLITGSFNDVVDFDPGAGIYNLTATSIDIFVCQLDASGSFMWAVHMGGIAASCIARSLAINNSGMYVTGKFNNAADFDPGAGTYNLTPVGGSTDIFIFKLDLFGNFIWAKQAGGIGNDIGNSIALDGGGNVYTTGNFTGTADFDPGTGISNLISAGSVDIFISKLDASGNFLWAKQMGGSTIGGLYQDDGLSIALDGNGNVFTTGKFLGTCDFDPGAGTYTMTATGGASGYDAFISKLDGGGNFVCAGRMGGTGAMAAGTTIATDGNGNVLAAGNFYYTVDFDPGTATANFTASQQDIFVSKLVGCAPLSVSASDAPVCSGDCAIITTISSGGISPYTYSWNPGGQTEQAIVVCPTLTTIYTVTITDASANTTSAAAIVTVNPVPLLNMTSTPASCPTCPDGTASANATGATAPYTYSWSPGGQIATTATGLLPGTYTICVTDTKGCTKCNAGTVSYATGAAEISSENNISVYPIPSSGNINVTITQLENLKMKSIGIYNLYGEKVYDNNHFQINSSSNLPDFRSDSYRIDLSAQPSGVYFIQIKAEDRILSKKIIIN